MLPAWLYAEQALSILSRLSHTLLFFIIAERLNLYPSVTTALYDRSSKISGATLQME